MSTDDTRPLDEKLGLGTRTDDATDRTEVVTADGEEATAAERATTHEHAADDTAGHHTGPARSVEETPRPWGDPPVYRRGPAPFGLFLGVVGLALAVGVLVTELVDVDVPWSDLGPWTVVAGGLLVVLVGLFGLRANRDGD